MVTGFAAFFFFNDTATTEIYTLSLHDALPISSGWARWSAGSWVMGRPRTSRSEEHTSELQSRLHLVCRLLLEKKKHTRAEGTLTEPGLLYGSRLPVRSHFPRVQPSRFSLARRL